MMEAEKGMPYRLDKQEMFSCKLLSTPAAWIYLFYSPYVISKITRCIFFEGLYNSSVLSVHAQMVYNFLGCLVEK
jgi:hypothetical protein